MSRRRTSRRVVLALMVPLGVSLALTGAPPSAGDQPGLDTDPIERLYGVHMISPSDVWAVGYDPGHNALAQHWDGTEWTTFATPPADGYQRLYAVDAAASDDVWAVGSAGLLEDSNTTFIEHWNGSKWKQVAAPSPEPSAALNGVSVVAADDIWASGFIGEPGSLSSECLLEHWDGTTWQRVDCPHGGLAGRAAGLLGLDMWSATQGWAVGFYHPLEGRYFAPLVERWNGQEWRQVLGRKSAAYRKSKLYSVAATGAGTAVASGYATRQFTPYIEQRDHSGWHLDTLFPQGLGSVDDLTARSRTDIWAAARNGLGDPLVLHFDGTEWKDTGAEVPRNGDFIHGIDASSPTDVWAVGWHFAEHWDGSEWQIFDDT